MLILYIVVAEVLFEACFSSHSADNDYLLLLHLLLSRQQSLDGGTVAVQQKELEQREREHAELMDRLVKEEEQFEEELWLFEENMRKLREEEKRVKEERERLKEEGKKLVKERKSLETQIRLIQHDSNH